MKQASRMHHRHIKNHWSSYMFNLSDKEPCAMYKSYHGSAVEFQDEKNAERNSAVLT